MQRSRFGTAIAWMAVFTAGCGPTGATGAAEPSGGGTESHEGHGTPPPRETSPAEPLVAAAELAGPAGSPVRGVITFTQSDGTVAVHAEISGVPDPGEHGFHVHDVGDCSAEDFSSAGGHFNPAGAPHAGPHDAPRHAGDLGNFTVADDGTGTLDLVTDLLTVADGPHSVVGRSVILHAARDDQSTQPTGNSGARIACGVVQAAAPILTRPFPTGCPRRCEPWVT